MVWHDYINDPPKKNGRYIILFKYLPDECINWDVAYYRPDINRWEKIKDGCIYVKRFYEVIKWAEVDMEENKMSGIEIYRDYTFMNSDNYKYTLSVQDDSTEIAYEDCVSGGWEKMDSFALPTNFAYEIAKKIVAECESNRYVDN